MYVIKVIANLLKKVFSSLYFHIFKALAFVSGNFMQEMRLVPFICD